MSSTNQGNVTSDYPKGATPLRIHVLQVFVDCDCELGKTAVTLGRRPATVKNNLSALREVVGVTNTTALIIHAIKCGWITI